MTKQEQFTAFLDERVVWPRMVSPYVGWSHSSLWPDDYSVFNSQPRPTVEQLATEVLRIAEVRALRLGAWLTTPDGELITEAVEAMSPPLYRQDVELLVAALTLAAKMQQLEGRERAGKFAVGAIGVAAVIAIGFGGAAGSRAA